MIEADQITLSLPFTPFLVLGVIFAVSLWVLLWITRSRPPRK
jgi:uncharacterized protein involved in response to NO